MIPHKPKYEFHSVFAAKTGFLQKPVKNMEQGQAEYLYYGALLGIFLLLVEKSRGDHLPDMRDAKKDMYHIFIQKKR